MTEAELVESAQLAYSNGIAAYASFWTIVFGYLVVAYLVGKNLKPSQVWIVNCLYLLASLSAGFGIFAFFNAGLGFTHELQTLNPDRGRLASQWILYATSTVNVVILLASLKFMWDVRHEERDT